MRYFSLFTGIGGLDYGLADWNECIGFSEIKKSSEKIYLSHYPKHKNYGDITRLDTKDLPDFDILTGGFPCQAFSLQGLRQGFGDKKGQMIFYVGDILRQKKPKYFILENVKGILNHRQGKTLEDILRLFTWLGYKVRILLLNACNYGSAQNRERGIFLGCKDDFEYKNVVKLDDSKRFRDIREDGGKYKYIQETERVKKKINGELDFKYELIGGYDRVGTLMTSYGGGEKLVQDDEKWRVLTLVECERLQGFPEGWTDGVGDSDRYFALGNAVNCRMSEYLMKDYLNGLWWNYQKAMKIQ